MSRRRRASFLVRKPLRTLAVLVLFVGWGTVAVNAVFLQDGPHPAPLVAARQVAEPAPEPTAAPEPAISEREREIVRELQRGLAVRGFYSGPVDGLPGERTREAIRAYQRRADLEVTGEHSEALIAHVELSSIGVPLPPEVDGGDLDEAGADTPEPTGAALSEDDAAAADIAALIERGDGAADGAPARGAADGGEDAPGDPTIERVQRILADLGYAPGEIDGYLGPSTRAAIRRFEEDRNLPPRGEPDERFLEELEAVSGETLG